MKRFLLPALGGAVLAFGLNAPVLAQVSVTFPGDPLQTIYAPDGSGALSANMTLAPADAGSGAGNRSASMTGNTVTLNSGGTVSDVFGAVNFQSTGTPLANNKVIINGGSVGTPIVGEESSAGAYYWLVTGDIEVNNNSVTVNGGSISGFIYGGLARVEDSGNPTANYNKVTTTGGTFTHGVYGGDAHSYGDGTATANHNIADIEGDQFDADIFGGYAFSESGSAIATYNTVIIGPNLPATTFSPSGTTLHGGFTHVPTPSGGSQTTSTNNTLKLASMGLSVKGLEYFQIFEFTLPASLPNNGTLLTVTDTAAVGTGNTGTGVKVTVDASALTLQPGNEYVLIDAGVAMTGSVETVSQSGKLKDSKNNLYNYTLGITGKQLWLKIGTRDDSGAAMPVPAASNMALAMLGLLLATLAAMTLRRQQVAKLPRRPSA